MGIVLVADDDRDTRDTLDELLVEAGYRVVQAADGIEALAALERLSEPCVALVDAHMPLMGGAELVRRIRSHARWRSMPVLVFTGDLRFEAAGATEILQKPFSVNRLLDLIRQHSC